MSNEWDFNKYFFGQGSSSSQPKTPQTAGNKFAQANANAAANIESFLNFLGVSYKKRGSTYLILDHMRGDKNYGSAHLCPRMKKYSDFATGMVGVDLVDAAEYYRPDLTKSQILDIMASL